MVGFKVVISEVTKSHPEGDDVIMKSHPKGDDRIFGRLISQINSDK